MRKILFRGKTLSVYSHWDDKLRKKIYTEGKWIYGGYGYCDGKAYIFTDEFMWHINKGRRRDMDGEIERIWVDPESVGQFINKRDVDDVRIFAGDIVEFYCGENLKFGEVKYNEEFASFVIGDEDRKDYEGNGSINIIGNKIDNPELLRSL